MATPRASRRASAALALTAQLLAFPSLVSAAARADAPQVVNVSARHGNQSEAAVAVDPSDPNNDN